MPAPTEKARRTWGMALACKRGNKRACKGPAKRMARRVGERKIREFAKRTSRR